MYFFFFMQKNFKYYSENFQYSVRILLDQGKLGKLLEKLYLL